MYLLRLKMSILLFFVILSVLSSSFAKGDEPDVWKIVERAVGNVGNTFGQMNNGDLQIPGIQQNIFSTSEGIFLGLNKLQLLHVNQPQTIGKKVTFSFIFGVENSNVIYKNAKVKSPGSFFQIPYLPGICATIQGLTFQASVTLDYNEKPCVSLKSLAVQNNGKANTHACGPGVIVNGIPALFVKAWTTQIVGHVKQNVLMALKSELEGSSNCEGFTGTPQGSGEGSKNPEGNEEVIWEGLNGSSEEHGSLEVVEQTGGNQVNQEGSEEIIWENDSGSSEVNGDLEVVEQTGGNQGNHEESEEIIWESNKGSIEEQGYLPTGGSKPGSWGFNLPKNPFDNSKQNSREESTGPFGFKVPKNPFIDPDHNPHQKPMRPSGFKGPWNHFGDSKQNSREDSTGPFGFKGPWNHFGASKQNSRENLKPWNGDLPFANAGGRFTSDKESDENNFRPWGFGSSNKLPNAGGRFTSDKESDENNFRPWGFGSSNKLPFSV